MNESKPITPSSPGKTSKSSASASGARRNDDGFLDLHYSMLRVRRVEERLLQVFSEGKIPGFIHVSIGQEAVASGVCSCLTPADTIFTTHRGHGHTLAKGMELKPFMAEIFGRANGSCHGNSGSMHVASKEAGVGGANGIVGAGMPIALGSAFASAFKGEDSVTVAFFGDGASNQGTFHESMNLAALWNLPLIFVCENNGWAQFSAQKSYMKVDNIYRRAEGYGMPGVFVDGEDVLKVREGMQQAVARARAGLGPTLLECKTHRWFGHFAGDPQKYRPSNDLEQSRNIDCIANFEKFLVDSEVASREQLDAVNARLNAEIDEAIAYAEASPSAGAGQFLSDVYA
ncbi:MAG TPA: thiamine pyrophosphate-dependent dehydrogenase E1 component subunit alpha [Pseudolabrys sp.]|nr:thiamine pyrophosphate-dependent dehydrogenase E1 component subunit alpha [Pseudolabrys sp.]